MNLQLFALNHTMQILKDDGGGGGKKPTTPKVGGLDPNSLVDYLKMNGEDSSYSARAVLADELGISNYKGSAEQNTQMLNMLKNGTTQKAETPKASTPKAETPKAETPKNDNVASSASTGIDTALETLTSIPAPSVSAETMAILNTPYTQSSAVQEAWNVTNAQKEKFMSGRTSYTDQIQSLLNQIQNRDKFSYDVDTDMLFQQALASAMGSGKQAMQDTMGQASALTGGYASTYAQSAGNQAYNAYIQDAYNNLPEYYQMALEAYNMEGQDMYNQLSMLNDADATEYQRMYDAYSASFDYAQNLQNFEYGQYQDNWNNAYNSANLELNQQGMAYDQAYNNYNAYADNYWNEQDKTYKYDVLASNEEQAELDRKQDRLEWGAEFGLKQDQWNTEKAYMEASANNAKVSGSTTEIDPKHFSGALEAYNSGGTQKLNEYLNSMSGIYGDAELEEIATYAGEYGNYVDPNDQDNPLPYKDRTWKVVDDGGWHLGKLDDNARIVDQYGRTITISMLYKALQEEGMSKAKAKEWIANLQEELGI